MSRLGDGHHRSLPNYTASLRGNDTTRTRWSKFGTGPLLPIPPANIRWLERRAMAKSTYETAKSRQFCLVGR
jgi:hypothetical protein